MNRVQSAYKSLLRRFGPQGWWPTTPEDGVSPVYVPRRPPGSLSEAARFEVCLGAILTQNTNWQNVVKVLSLLKKNHSLSLSAFQRLPLSKTQRYLRSSGYFRQKTARARGFFRAVERETGGDLKRFFEGPLPNVREKLLSLNGIGPETADSMLLYAAGRPLFVVDAYTRRFGARRRILNGKETYGEIQRIFMSNLPLSAKIFAEYHALIVKSEKEI